MHNKPFLVLLLLLVLLSGLYLGVDAVFDANMGGSNLRSELTEEELQAEYDCWMLLAERGGLEPDEIKELCQP